MDRAPLWNRVEGPIPTADGSWTLRDAEHGQLFHNSAGAWSESWHHYAQPVLAGLTRPRPDSTWRVLDACFGLGYATWAVLDAWLALPTAERPTRIEVTAFEQDAGLAAFWPLVLEQDCVRALRPLRDRFPACPAAGRARIWNGSVGTCHIELRLTTADFRTALREPDERYDVILHDPFTPMRAAHLWTAEIFKIYHRWLAPHRGVLATYSTSIAVLGALREAGFFLYRTPRLGKKRGGTLALCAPTELPGDPAHWALSPEDEAALRSRSGLPYRDPTLRAHNASLIRVRNQEVRDSSLPPRDPMGR